MAPELYIRVQTAFSPSLQLWSTNERDETVGRKGKAREVKDGDGNGGKIENGDLLVDLPAVHAMFMHVGVKRDRRIAVVREERCFGALLVV